MRFQPRKISPGVMEYGDLVTVEIPSSGGITTSYKGRARIRTTSGRTNYWRTIEGSVLVAWESDGKQPHVTLLDREPAPQSMLEDI